ncbi:hypothetical protein FD755_024141 [Muntiacus reevesi]|uniref:Mos1 transposase HTH domain-containing protein n=1 Tax=Muntiacus reevesi TaxID=9886 RepID=A0A5N3VVF8_MUNRE|nr:hypothetical protein FD755_024141 [Muntiacus reevesi]
MPSDTMEIMLHKNSETTCNINNAFGPGTANENTAQQWFKKFSKGDKNLEDEEPTIIKTDSVTTTREAAEELNVNHSMVIRHLKQIGKKKKLDKWVPHELSKILKIVVLKCPLLLFYATSNHFSIRQTVTCYEKWMSNLHQKKIMVTVWWSAGSLNHYSFLNPGKTITSENYQCLQPALVNRKGPILLHDITPPHVTQLMLQKLNELGYEVLPHLPYSPDLSPTDYHFFRLFSGKSFHNQQDTEYAFQNVVESQITNFYAKGINKLISRQQKFVDCNSSYFD